MTDSAEKVRVDKWLWAARFFKTRSLARAAIEGGKVHTEGQRVKPSKEVQVGMTLKVRNGQDEKEIVVKNISAVRRSAAQAALLYEETPASLARRESETQARRLARDSTQAPEKRPTKKQRRQIHRFKQTGFSD